VTTPGRQTFLSAALTVLSGASTPLTVRQITEEALRRDLLSTEGKTPEQSMAAELYKAVARSPNGPLVRIFEPGQTRARRGSVRWLLRQPARP